MVLLPPRSGWSDRRHRFEAPTAVRVGSRPKNELAKQRLAMALATSCIALYAGNKSEAELMVTLPTSGGIWKWDAREYTAWTLAHAASTTVGRKMVAQSAWGTMEDTQQLYFACIERQ